MRSEKEAGGGGKSGGEGGGGLGDAAPGQGTAFYSVERESDLRQQQRRGKTLAGSVKCFRAEQQNSAQQN